MPLTEEKNWKAPATFAEYVEMNPDGNVRWLRSHYKLNASDFDDVAQEILIFIVENKIVEKYDPESFTVSDSPALFFNYMSMNFNFALGKILDRRKYHVRSINYNALSLDSVTNKNGDSMIADDIMPSNDYKHRCEKEGDLVFIKTRVAEFRAYVEKHRPEIIPMLDRFLDGDEDRAEYRILMPMLSVLAKYFKRGNVPGKRMSKKKAQQLILKTI
jgi:hypothetical protein